MLKPIYTTRFEKDLKRCLKRGNRQERLKMVMGKLVRGEPLEPKWRDHPLKGNYISRRECHLEPDWLLIYKLTHEEIIFERLGSHSDLFE